MSAETLLALDVGDVRIGVALSRSGVIAEPLTTIERTGRTQTLDALQQIVEEHHVTLIVIGVPLLEGGAEGEQAAKSRAFARSFQRRLPAVKVAFHDERYTTADAREIAGKRAGPGTTKGLVDRIAAAIILQSYLDLAANTKKKDEHEGVSGTP
ncbi:Holliday junction resolvase RuvX [Candidatus Sumerlaeota bacterium]|nr:Holliday junction resolvase RuvX [Candidatus Sumerlaeota bacterium]